MINDECLSNDDRTNCLNCLGVGMLKLFDEIIIQCDWYVYQLITKQMAWIV